MAYENEAIAAAQKMLRELHMQVAIANSQVLHAASKAATSPERWRLEKLLSLSQKMTTFGNDIVHVTEALDEPF